MAQIKQSEGGQSGSMTSHLVFGAIGLITGTSLTANLWGAFSGACLGFLFSNWNSSRAQLDNLRGALARLEAQISAIQDAPGYSSDHSPPRSLDDSRHDDPVGLSQESEPTGPPMMPDSIGLTGDDPAESDSLEDAVASVILSRPASAEQAVASLSNSSMQRTQPAQPQGPTPPGPIEKAMGSIRSFFLGGNTIVRVGLLVLLVGLTLLAKYAAENALFPVEARLAFAGLVGLGLVALGFRQRVLRPGFGMSLQGGGIAALYLVTFFAFKVYGLVPSGLAFALFVGLAVATVLLSVLQRSEPLLVIGSLGGFLAPILASTGDGNHVALFSYYLILNTSIAFVAWRQTWRIPALVAFVCTYLVAGTWGTLRYAPENFITTEPFVLAFMSLFTGIAVLHAWRKPPELRGIVDGTLVFGTPFVSILFQNALVRDREMGLAFSAAGFGLFYAAWAVVIWRAAPRALRPLAEAFIALAVGFATMAIPFAFDGALTTSVAWALEGAGLYWIGARQSRAFPRFAGMALQFFAGFAFFGSLLLDQLDTSSFVPIANGRAISCLALAMAGMFIARQAYVTRGRLRPVEIQLAQLLGILGLVWWSGGSIAEILDFVPDALTPAACLTWIAATAIALEIGGQRSGWLPGRLMALASLLGAIVLLPPTLYHVPHLLADGGWIAWPLLFATFHFLWQRMGGLWIRPVNAFRAGSLWLLTLTTAIALSGLVDVGFGLATDWRVAGFGFGVASVLLGLMSLQKRERPPFDRESESGLAFGVGPIAAFALITIIGTQFAARGDASPLPYFPVLGPVDLVIWLLGLSLFRWWRGLDADSGIPVDPSKRIAIKLVGLGAAFIGLNGMLARAVHQWGGISFDPESLWESSAMQVALSIAWTLTGMVGMLHSSRQGWRSSWMGFAGLLGVVVVKLFTVDLSQLSTLSRIGTFLAVGGLLLVLGYVSPVPPGDEDEISGRGDEASDDASSPLGGIS